jgi:hypothetical protein
MIFYRYSCKPHLNGSAKVISQPVIDLASFCVLDSYSVYRSISIFMYASRSATFLIRKPLSLVRLFLWARFNNPTFLAAIPICTFTCSLLLFCLLLLEWHLHRQRSCVPRPTYAPVHLSCGARGVVA